MALDVLFVVTDVSVQVAMLFVQVVLDNEVPQCRMRDMGVVRCGVVLRRDLVLFKRERRRGPIELRVLTAAMPVRIEVHPSMS